MMKKYLAYKIFTSPFMPELISGVLWQLDLMGIIEEEDHIKIFLNDNSTNYKSSLTEELEKLKREGLIESFETKMEIIEDKNWNKSWEKSRQLIRVGDRIIIKPSFKEYCAKKGEIVLTIDPKMSFGTGEHQSTQLALGFIEKYVQPGIKILDVGSGTGILAIAAVKLGADNAIAVDSDENCLENCNENCILNNVQSSVEILSGKLQDVDEEDFDLIVANIHKNVLIDISGEVRKRARADSLVILSGLLEQDFDEIYNHYLLKSFHLIDKSHKDDWIGLTFQLRAN